MIFSCKWGMRLMAVVIKETRHIVRDPQTLFIIIVMPIVMMFLYGYALTMDITETRVVVEDPEGSTLGRYLARSIDASTMFHVVLYTNQIQNPQHRIMTYRSKAVFRLAPDFYAQSLKGNSRVPVSVFIDGSDQNTATILRNSVQSLIQRIIFDYQHVHPPIPVEVKPYILYNQYQKSSLYFIPGLMAIILMMISALLTSLTITREKENATIEHLLISPLKSWEIIIGKMIPYILLSILDGVVILFVGYLFFQVQVQGSMLLLGIASLIYIIVALALGLLFSTLADNQQQAMLMVLPATLLPTIVLSGFIFPVRSMPFFLQIIAHGIPATYYLEIIRGIIIKGVGITQLWRPFLALTLFAVIVPIVALKLFRRNP